MPAPSRAPTGLMASMAVSVDQDMQEGDGHDEFSDEEAER